MRSRHLALVSVVTLAACAGGPASPAPVSNRSTAAGVPDAPLAGTFTIDHTIMMVCDQPEWCEEEVTDTLVVTPAAAGAIEVSIELVQTNGHTCGFDGTLTPDAADSTRWRFQTPDDADDAPCDLTLTRHADRLELDSEGCRHYCGARAHLGATFPLASR